jgi:hypothetical protein
MIYGIFVFNTPWNACVHKQLCCGYVRKVGAIEIFRQSGPRPHISQLNKTDNNNNNNNNNKAKPSRGQVENIVRTRPGEDGAACGFLFVFLSIKGFLKNNFGPQMHNILVFQIQYMAIFLL